MEYIKASKILAPQSLVNLKTLLEGIQSEKLNVSFNISTWSTNRGQLASPQDVKNECGTVCCLAGYGPLVGLAAHPNETWDKYAKRVF